MSVSRNQSNLYIYNNVTRVLPNADFGRLAHDLDQAAKLFGLKWSKASWVFTNGSGDQPILHIAYEAQTIYGSIDIERSFYFRTPDLIAEHDILGIPELLQGNDFSRFINGILYRFYKQNNFKVIITEAGLDVGGYVWARTGFAATRRADLDKIVADAYLNVGLSPKITLSTVEYIEEDVEYHYSVFKDAPFPIYEWLAHPDKAGIEEILKGSKWHGELYFADSVQTAIFERYVHKYKHLNP